MLLLRRQPPVPPPQVGIGGVEGRDLPQQGEGRIRFALLRQLDAARSGLVELDGCELRMGRRRAHDHHEDAESDAGQ